MEPQQVQQLILNALPDCEVVVTGDGSHFEATVIGNIFESLSPVKKQQTVYATVKEHITSGTIHALSIKTYTPEEWVKAKKLQVGA